MQGKKNRKRNRLLNHDYSLDGWYFITICTKNRTEWFGDIVDGRMILSKAGKIVEQRWVWLMEQYEYVKLDKFIVMPNHFHGILIIERTGHDLSLQNKKIKSISGLIGAYKTTSSKYIHQEGLIEFTWQRSFYDHIIRDDDSLQDIRKYICNNPLKWHLDKYNLHCFT